MRSLFLGLGVACSVASIVAAQATSLSADYLVGRWASGETANCTNPAQEQTEFRADGTFATVYGGRALAVGFWQVQDDKIDMHILSTEASLPASVRDALPGDYHTLHVRGLAFDITEGGFRMVQSIAGELRGLNLVRCPAT